MENIFRCSICNKEYNGYEAEKNCLNDEINCLNLKPKLDLIIKDTIDILKKEYEVNIIEEQHDVRADSADFGMSYEIYKFFNGKAEYKNKKFDFYITSDSVGDGRYECTLDSSENIINSFLFKYLRDKEVETDEIIGEVKLFENNNTEDENSHDYYRGWVIGNHNVEDLMYNLEGRKIKIEIIG